MNYHNLRLKANAVKRAAARRDVIKGCHLTFAAPSVIEVLASLELDFIYIDGEHGTFDRAQLDSLLELAIAGIKTLDAAQTKALSE